MKKSISVFVAIVLLLSLFSGCTGQAAEEKILRNATKIEAENSDQDFMGEHSDEEPAQEPAEKPASAIFHHNPTRWDDYNFLITGRFLLSNDIS